MADEQLLTGFGPLRRDSVSSSFLASGPQCQRKLGVSSSSISCGIPSLYSLTRLIIECGIPQPGPLKDHFVLRLHRKQKRPSAL